MSNYGIHKLCRLALHDHAIRQALKDDPVKAMEQFPLTDEEKKLLLAGSIVSGCARPRIGVILMDGRV